MRMKLGGRGWVDWREEEEVGWKVYMVGDGWQTDGLGGERRMCEFLDG